MRTPPRRHILRVSMLVKVHLLRQAGERLRAEDVRARPALVGWIRLYGGQGVQLDRSERVAVLQLPEGAFWSSTTRNSCSGTAAG